MIAVLTHHWAKDDKFDDAKNLLAKNGAAQSKHPGFIRRVACVSLNDPTKITTLVTWDSNEIYDDWKQSAQRESIMKDAGHLWSKPPESERFDVVE